MKVVVSQFDGVDSSPALPLAAGCLVASARTDPRLAGWEYAIEVGRDPVDAVVERLAGADVLGFSLYPWNAGYSLAVAEAARAANPDALIVAGGPAVPRRPESARRFFAERPVLDAIVFSEGELVFRDLLAAGDLGSVGGIAYRRGGEIEFTAPPVRIRDTAPTASPYLDGTFDALVAEGRERFTLAMLETNRGCPFTCTFCDWSLTRHVVEFPLERVEAELEWVAAHGFGQICICDANFGIRPRDDGIARMITEAKRRHGSPTYCFFYLTKNNHRRNLETIEILHGAGIACCVGLSVQDFDDDVLEAIRRDTIQSGESVALRDICAARGIPTHNELILGLPAQTFDSFSRSLIEAMPPFAGHSFVAFQCRLLDNTELASPESRALHGIESRRCRWVPADTEWRAVVEEHQDLVVGTATMPVAEWRRTYRLTYFASALYNYRLLRVVLQAVGTLGADRVGHLVALAEATAVAPAGSALAEIGATAGAYSDSILAGEPWTLHSPHAGGARLTVEAAIAAVILARADDFYSETQAVTEAFLGDAPALLEEAFRYESLLVPRHLGEDPEPVDFAFDWPSYAASGSFDAPLREPVRVEFSPPAYARQPDSQLFVRAHLATVLAGMASGSIETAPSAPAVAQAG